MTRRNNKRREEMVANVRFAIVVGIVLLICIAIVKMPIPDGVQDCEWGYCDCNPDSPYHYHCTVHGDGHSCY